MANNSTNNKLDDKVKDVLSNFQADLDTMDWAKMENKLNATSSSTKFNLKYIIYITIFIAVAGSGYLIFNSVRSDSNKPIEKTINPETKIETKEEPPITKEEKPIVPTIDSSVSKTKEDSHIENDTEIKKSIVNKNTTEKAIESRLSSKKIEHKTKNDKDTSIKQQTVYTMGNEPVFGDMLDSSKGIIGRTKESDETKKAAKSKTNVPIGWNTFMLKNVNIDSLRNHRGKTDSIK